MNEERIELGHQNSSRAQQTPTPRNVPMDLSRSWAFQFLYIFFTFISKVVHGGHLPWKLWADMKLLPRPTQSLPLYLSSHANPGTLSMSTAHLQTSAMVWNVPRYLSPYIVTGIWSVSSKTCVSAWCLVRQSHMVGLSGTVSRWDYSSREWTDAFLMPVSPRSLNWVPTMDLTCKTGWRMATHPLIPPSPLLVLVLSCVNMESLPTLWTS